MAWHVSANLGRDKPQWVIWRAILRVWMLAGSRGIVGFQEIGEADQHNERRRIWRVFGRVWRRDRAGWARRVPIVFNGALWRKVEQKVTHLSDGVKGVSPPRVLVEVLLENRITGRRVARLNTHFIARPDLSARRRAYSDQAVAITTERVHWWHDRGYDVVLSGDFNLKQKPQFHRKQVVGVEHSVDAIIAVPGPGREAVVGKTRVKKLGIDFHRAIGANIKFKEAA